MSIQGNNCDEDQTEPGKQKMQGKKLNFVCLQEGCSPGRGPPNVGAGLQSQPNSPLHSLNLQPPQP
jgi:hypothetical protein